MQTKFVYFCCPNTEIVAQLVRASDCDSEGRGFEPPHSPRKGYRENGNLFILLLL